MQSIRKEEIKALINQISNPQLKEKLNGLIHGKIDEIKLSIFFEEIKKLDMVEDTDYNLILLLEEFYLRFKDLEA